MDDQLVTVATVGSLGAAMAARARLEAEGIAALVLEQDALRIRPLLEEKGPKIRIQVRREDEELARELLDPAQLG